MKNIKIGLLIFGLIIFNACKIDQKNNVDKETLSESQITEENNAQPNENLLIGSWIDTSQAALHFTLFADGTAQSDNMKTLLYKHWRTNGKKIIFTIESIGNKTSSTDEEVYEIQKVDENKLILKKKDTSYTYERANKKTKKEEKFLMLDTDEINKRLANTNRELTARDVMQMYYPFQVEGNEGNEKIEINAEVTSNGNTIVTLIHDNLLDDSVKGEKRIMELKRTNNKWTVISIKRNWKCRKNRGDSSWGISVCQ